MKLICKTWMTWSSIKLLLRSLGECKCICIFPLHLLPACFLIWQGLAIGDWRENQIKATHQPIANRTENVSLMMGCVTRWKVSPWLCISKSCLGKNAKLPVLSKQTQLYKMKYANGCSSICGIGLNGKLFSSYSFCIITLFSWLELLSRYDHHGKSFLTWQCQDLPSWACINNHSLSSCVQDCGLCLAGCFLQFRLPTDFELTATVTLINCIFTALDQSMMDEEVIYYGSSYVKMIDFAWERRRFHRGTAFALILEKLVEAVESRSQNIVADGQCYSYWVYALIYSLWITILTELKKCVCALMGIPIFYEFAICNLKYEYLHKRGI